MSKILIDEALRLADAIELGWLENVDSDKADIDRIQAELRRLHAENQTLRQAIAEAEQPAQQEPVGFEEWWSNEGSQAPKPTDDMYEHCKRMCEIAWANGAYKALEQPAPLECVTEAEKTAFAFGWFKALESVREQQKPVAEYIGECSDGSLVQLYDDIKKGAKLYAAPQAQPAGYAKKIESLIAERDALKAKLTEQPAPAQEPVIQDWMKPDALCDKSCLYACTEGFTKFPTCVPPTAPTQEPDPDELTIAYMSGLYEGKKRKPLTDEQIEEIAARTLFPVNFARAIEAAHGIKGNT